MAMHLEHCEKGCAEPLRSADNLTQFGPRVYARRRWGAHDAMFLLNRRHAATAGFKPALPSVESAHKSTQRSDANIHVDLTIARRSRILMTIKSVTISYVRRR